MMVILILSYGVSAQTSVKHFTENFDGEVDTAFWAYNWAAGLIDGDRDENTFKYETNELGNYFLGVILQFVNEDIVLDLKESPVVSFKAKAANATINGVAADSIPIGMDLINMAGDNIGLFYTKAVIATDGDWYDCVFDFSSIADQPGMDSIAKIRFNPGKDRFDGWVNFSGTVWIDDFEAGGEIVIPPTEMTSYEEDFTDSVDMSIWAPNSLTLDDGTPVFDVTQANGEMKYVVKQKNFYDGQFMNFTKHANIIFDISGNPYLNVKLKVMPGAMYDSVAIDSVPFLISPWGRDTTGTLVREISSPVFNVPADGEWHEYTYDFGAKVGVPMWNGVIPPGEFDAVEAILIESVTYPKTYDFTYYMDDFKLGDAAAPPKVLTTYEEDFTDTVDMSIWAPNSLTLDDGTPVFDVTQADGEMKYVVKQKNFYDGQFMNFTKHANIIFDISGNPYLKVNLKVMPGAMYDSVAIDSVPFLISPWGRDTTGTLVREISSPVFNVPADGEWHEYTYDFGAKVGVPMWNGVIPPGEFDAVEAILIESVTYPKTYDFTYYMDDFKLGDAAAPPKVLTTYKEDFTDPVDMSIWAPNSLTLDDGTPVFDVTQADGEMKYVVKQKNFYDGQFMNFTKHANIIFDISGNPYLKVNLKVMPGAMYDSVVIDSVPFLISPWGRDTTGTLVREISSPVFNVPADGEWHEYTYDFGAKVGVPMWNGVIPPGEFDAVEAILIETVTYPKTYDFTYYMDDFRLGDASAPLNQNKDIPFVAGKFWAQFKVTATDSPMNGAVGMSKNPVENWSDFGPIVRFNTDGFIDVRNGSFYDSDVAYPFIAGKEYIVELIGDVNTQTYSVNVEADGVKTVLATDYAFRNDTPQDTLNYLDVKVYDKPDFGGVPGSTLKASFMKDDYVLGWNNTVMKDLAMFDKYNVKATLTPSANLINAGFALSKEEPALLGWGDLSPIIRFNNAGFIDVRDGGAYNADLEMAYSAGKAYYFDIDIDVPNQKYSVKVTPANGSEKTLAADYGFRKEADTLKYITKLQLNGGPWGGAIGDLLISDVEVNSTKVQELNLTDFNVYPNPFEDNLSIISEDAIQKLVVLDVLGSKLIELNTNNTKDIKVNVSNLINGTYIINIYTNKGLSSKVIVKE